MDSEAVLRDVLGDSLQTGEPMSRHTTLKVGGPARWFWPAADAEMLVRVLRACAEHDISYLFVGHGSNLLMSDTGYDGLVIQNRCKGTKIGAVTEAESGVSFGSLFHQTARTGLSGLEWAIGIPGTVGGALVSNAGAYRGNIGPLVRGIRVFDDGLDQFVGPEWMEFSYRDSKLRRHGVGRSVVISCTIELTPGGDPESIIARAKDYQAQRRAKQPLKPSAGSFFKNVYDKELAESLSGLAEPLRIAGVIPTGFLIESCGLKGYAVGGAMVSREHGNFLINASGATASDLRAVAEHVKRIVHERFGAVLSEEVLYVGDWSEWERQTSEGGCTTSKL